MLDGPAGQYWVSYGVCGVLRYRKSGSGPACLPGGWRHRMWLQIELETNVPPLD